jgi:ketosteroid isomerase-like protein
MSDITRLLERGYTMIWQEGRVEDALRGLGDDFEWVVPDHPEGAVRRGADSVIEFFYEWIEPWEDLEVDYKLEAAGTDAALAVIDMRGTGRVSGVPTEMRFFQLWTFRDGRAVRMEMFQELDDARRAAGLDPPAAPGAP